MKEGSVIEGIFAMYCALVLIDPDDGSDINKIKSKIRNMRLNSQLREESKGERFRGRLSSINCTQRMMTLICKLLMLILKSISI